MGYDNPTTEHLAAVLPPGPVQPSPVILGWIGFGLEFWPETTWSYMPTISPPQNTGSRDPRYFCHRRAEGGVLLTSMTNHHDVPRYEGEATACTPDTSEGHLERNKRPKDPSWTVDHRAR